MILPPLPPELDVEGVFLPPLLVAAVLGTLLAVAITRGMDRLDLSRFVWHPPLFFVALAVLATGLIGLVVLPV